MQINISISQVILWVCIPLQVARILRGTVAWKNQNENPHVSADQAHLPPPAPHLLLEEGTVTGHLDRVTG